MPFINYALVYICRKHNYNMQQILNIPYQLIDLVGLLHVKRKKILKGRTRGNVFKINSINTDQIIHVKLQH